MTRPKQKDDLIVPCFLCLVSIKYYTAFIYATVLLNSNWVKCLESTSFESTKGVADGSTRRFKC